MRKPSRSRGRTDCTGPEVLENKIQNGSARTLGSADRARPFYFLVRMARVCLYWSVRVREMAEERSASSGGEESCNAPTCCGLALCPHHPRALAGNGP